MTTLSTTDAQILADLETRLAELTEPEEFHFGYSTNTLRGPDGQMLPLRSWEHFADLLAEVIRNVTVHGRYDFLILENSLQPSRWAQMMPEAPGAHRVEVGDLDGWADHVRSGRLNHTWSTELTEAIMRAWVQDLTLLAGDLQRVPEHD